MTKDTRTDDELNRIIAEWMGWVKCHCADKECGVWYAPKDADPSLGYPEYCTDLNLLNEAFGSLSDDQKHFLRAVNIEIASRDSEWYEGLSARQRAEALVKVIEEGKK